MYQLGAMATADWWLSDHLLTTGSLFANIANNYDKFNYTNPPRTQNCRVCVPACVSMCKTIST
jgi:hypothetical protein